MGSPVYGHAQDKPSTLATVGSPGTLVLFGLELAMKQKSTAQAPLFSAGLWLAYGLLETVFGLGAAHALTLVLLGLLAWFALYLIWGLSPPEEPRWKMHVRITAVMCV